jgi:predicted small lipoprotein YifL
MTVRVPEKSRYKDHDQQTRINERVNRNNSPRRTIHPLDRRRRGDTIIFTTRINRRRHTMANLKHIAATLALLGTASFTVAGCGDKKPTEVPGDAAHAEGEGSCSGADKAEGSCSGDKAEGSCSGEAAAPDEAAPDEAAPEEAAPEG